jgi:hypothetical protein
MAVQPIFTSVKTVIFSTPKKIVIICLPQQIEIRTLKKKIKDRVQTETAAAHHIYQEELALPNFSKTVFMALASAAIDASEFSFQNFNWFPLFHRRLNCAFSLLASLVFLSSPLTYCLCVLCSLLTKSG